MLNRGDFVGRWDPYYYKKDFLDLRKYLISLPNVQKVGSLIASCSRGDGPREGFYTEDADNGVYFLRVNNLKNHTIDLKDIKLINRHIHEKTLKRTKVAPGDIVFAVSGTKDNLGTVSIVPEYIHEANLNSALLRLRLKDHTVSKEYFTYYFDFDVADRQIDMIGKGAAQNNLNSEEIFSMLIPVLSSEDQQVIVDKLQAIKRSKEDKEAQAQALLDSIDGYLLGELGVMLPPEPENTIENRMFKTSWRQVSGGRYDPTFHQGNVYGSIANTSYELVPLRKLIQYFQTGFAAGRGDQDLEGNGIIQIRPTNMSSSRELIFDKNVRISPEEGQDYSRDLLVSGEVLFNNTNSQELVGKTVYFDLKGEYFCSNHLTRIKTNERLDGEYLTHLFNLYQRQKVFFKSCINWNNQSGINTDILRGVKIPLPDIHTQKTIAEHINDIRQQAQALRQQAQREFAQAKQEIERLILG